MDKIPIFSRRTGLPHRRDELLEIGDVIADEENTRIIKGITRRGDGTPSIEIKSFCRRMNQKLLMTLQ